MLNILFLLGDLKKNICWTVFFSYLYFVKKLTQNEFKNIIQELFYVKEIFLYQGVSWTNFYVFADLSVLMFTSEQCYSWAFWLGNVWWFMLMYDNLWKWLLLLPCWSGGESWNIFSFMIFVINIPVWFLFDSHAWSYVEVSGKLLIPYCLCLPSCD